MSTIQDDAREGSLVPVDSLSPAMQLFQRWTVIIFAFSACFHLFFRLVLHFHEHLAYPFSLNKRDRFADFTVFTHKFTLFHTAAFYPTDIPIIYPAPCWHVFNFFFHYAAPHSLPAFVAFSVVAFALPAILFGRSLAKRGIAPGRAALFAAILLLLSWPAALIVDGANVEVAVWIAMVIAMWAYSTGRLWTAAVWFGIAASLKLFPFVFLALFLSRRHILKAVAGVASFALTTLAALKLAGPTLMTAYHGYAYGMNYAKSNYFIHWLRGEQGVDHSLFAFFKTASMFVIPQYKDFSLPLQIYSAATAIGGVLLYFLVIRRQPLLNQILVFSIVAIYFTPFSGDGTLIHLYYPLAMIFLLSLQAYRDGVVIPGMKPILYCMIFCLSVDSFMVIVARGEQIRLIGPAHAVALGIMLVAALRYPLGPPLSAGYDETVLTNPVTDWVARSV